MKRWESKSNKAFWFRCVLAFLRIFFRKRKFIFEGDVPGKDSIIMSNHSAASGPVFFELYAGFKTRFWGTHEMTEGIKSAYKYLSKNYLPKKKHFPQWLSYPIAVIIVPFVRLFYRGLKLIPTYGDLRFHITLNKTFETLKNGETVIIFPEDSHDGYHKELTHFFPGGFFIARKYAEKVNDPTLFPCYYVKSIRSFAFGKGIRYSELSRKYGTDYQKMADEFCDLCNDLGKRYEKIKKI